VGIEDVEEDILFRELRVKALIKVGRIMGFHYLDRLSDIAFADTMLNYIIRFNPRGFLKKIVSELKQPGLTMRFLESRYRLSEKNTGKDERETLIETARNPKFYDFIEKYILDEA